MENMKKNTALAPYIFSLIGIAYIFCNGLVEGKMIAESSVKGTVKTIQSGGGDIIDCVDIYKQPAFDHPLLKNHTLQLKPTSTPRRPVNSTNDIPVQSWLKYGQCPDGSVPIIRKYQSNILKRPAGPSEFAQVIQFKRNYGAYAKLNVWNPKVEKGEYSAARIQVRAGNEDGLNSIEAGWIVNPDLYGDSLTRIYIYWTIDNYKNTGCYNLDCPGFVQTSGTVATGYLLEPVSVYGGAQYEITVQIYKDMKTKNWWVRIQGVDVGYWPASVFTRLRVTSAKQALWGGEIVNRNSAVHHTTTQMGSGHFPNEATGRSSFFQNMGYVDPSGIIRDTDDLQLVMTNPEYYTLVGNTNDNNFFYGGPGYYYGV